MTLLIKTIYYNNDNDNNNDDDDDEMIYFRAFNDKNTTHQMTMKTKWFQIDYRSGLITTHSLIDCEMDPEPELIIIVCDSLNIDSTKQQQQQQRTTINENNPDHQIGFTATTILIISINDVSFVRLSFFQFII